MKKIAVIGATGMLGIPVVIELVNAGFEVTALVRDPAKAKRLLPERINVVTADIADVESLKRGLRGHDAVYLSLSVDPAAKMDDFHAEAEGLENILTAAHAAGIGRIGYLSAMIQDGAGLDWWVIGVWRCAIARIKSSGIPYTIFYPTNFMETIPQRHLLGNVLTLIGTAPYPNYWISGRDYGKQVAASFQKSGQLSREYAIQGPEAMTYDEAGHRFAAHSKTKPFVIKIPMMLIRALGCLSRPMHFNAQIMTAVLNYPEQFKAGETWNELGKPSTTMEQFAKAL